MDIGRAIHHAKSGDRVARRGWNGPDQFVYYVPPGRFPPKTKVAERIAAKQSDGLVPYREYLALLTVEGEVAMWQPSVGDALAMDWYVKEVDL